MDKLVLLELQKHPKYEAVVTEVINNKIDSKLMAEALRLAKSKSQAEALYVKLKLLQSES